MTEDQIEKTTGRLPDEAVHVLTNRIPPSIIERYRKLIDPTGTISDALDDMGIVGCVPGSELPPSIEGACIVGTAVTVRNVPGASQAHLRSTAGISGLAEIEGHNQTEPGDVLVIQGVAGISNMGGISARLSKRQGAVGAVVDGGVRDLGTSRELGFPIWARGFSPITGKWRLQTVEVNGPVVIGHVPVNAGDLVVADETGICFVPAEVVVAVLERCEFIANGEDTWQADIDAGVPIPTIARRRYVYGKS